MVEQLQGRLHRGEVEVIIGAKELGIQTVVIDDRSARNLAEALLFTTIGVIGILLLVKRTGKFTEVRPYLDDISTIWCKAVTEYQKSCMTVRWS